MLANSEPGERPHALNSLNSDSKGKMSLECVCSPAGSTSPELHRAASPVLNQHK